ncbi:MAG: hypothetical protein ACI4QW_04350 [Clostridia bacterium]
MNSRSNLAYEHHTAIEYPAQSPQKQSNVRIRVSKKKQQAAQKRERALGIVKILLVVSCAFVVLYRGVMITDKCAAVDAKKAELEALVTSNEKLQFEIDRSLDLKNVEAIAQNELGMRRAEKYQTVYIDLEQVDYVEKTAKSEFSPASRVAEFITGLTAYLD